MKKLSKETSEAFQNLAKLREDFNKSFAEGTLEQNEVFLKKIEEFCTANPQLSVHGIKIKANKE